MTQALIEINGLSVNYGQIEAVRSVSLSVGLGQIAVLLGPNGAGKSSTLGAIFGLASAKGSIRFLGGEVLGRATEQIVKMGLSLVPEGRRVFPSLTVAENLAMGAASVRNRATIQVRLDEQLARFPILSEKFGQPAGLLSGGQQQMLAIARALMSGPRLLILDEPSLGLAPQIVEEIFELLVELRASGTTILLVEQNAVQALSIADKGWVLQNGRIAVEGLAENLLASDHVRQAYLAL